ncbi:MAG: hypothetical protein ABI647_16635 [Gemmatimonadota bacterium]
MRTTVLFLLAVALGSTTASAQVPKKSRLRQLAGKLVDSAVTSVAGMAVDSLLGSKGKSLAGILGTGELAGVSCPAGTTPQRVGSVPAGLGQPVVIAPTAGQTLVSAAKKRLAGKRTVDTAATLANISANVVCLTPQQLTAVMPGQPGTAEAQAAAAQAAAMQAAGAAAQGPNMTKMLIGATPAGAMIAGAAAAAPMAGKAAKALGGFLGRGPQSKEAMIKDLAHGKLFLKGVKFIEGSDALEAGFEDDLAVLVEALQAVEGSYILNIPAETDGKAPADTVIPRRRLQKLWAHLLVAGVQEPKLRVLGVYPTELDPKKKPPKPGDSKVEIIRLPADFKP